jgi:acetyltransferase-like isoleucine patch superfamily enzyme
LTRWLYFRAMGAKIAYGVHCAVFTRLRDFPLLTIESGVNLSANTHIAAHIFIGEKLFLAPVKISENSFIGMDVTIGARTRIGKNSFVGVGNRLVLDIVPENSRIENFQYFAGTARNNKMNFTVDHLNDHSDDATH